MLTGNFDPGGNNSATNDWTTADFDMDVDVTDFKNLTANFAPGGYGGAAPAQIPEPSTLWLLVIGFFGAACWRYGRLKL